MSKQSLRQIARELDISPAYLSYMVNGKRPWRKDLYQRYVGVVNTFVNSEQENINSPGGAAAPQSTVVGTKKLERAMGFEPTTSCLGSKHSTPELRPLVATAQAWRPAELVYQTAVCVTGNFPLENIR